MRLFILIVIVLAASGCSSLDQAPDPIDQAVAQLIAQ